MKQVQEHYAYLHTIPEEGFQEVKTSQYIKEQLESYGYTVQSNLNGTTGLVGILESNIPGPTVMVRADMDALGHVIEGVRCSRHTCGHDGHSSMLLSAAERIIREGLWKRGTLKVLFQPAEELGTGALAIIESGVVDDVDYMLGCHLRPIQELVKGQAAASIQYSACASYVAYVSGVPAHGARPHLGVNAIEAASMAIQSVNAIRLAPTENYSVKPTRFLSDSGVTNAIPDQAEVTWDLRAQYNHTMEELEKKLVVSIENSVKANGSKVELKRDKIIPAAELDEEVTNTIEKVLQKVVGVDNTVPSIVTPGGEDFFFYTTRLRGIKGGFWGLGCNLEPGLHHPDMHFDVDALETGVTIWVELLKELQNKE